MNNIILETDRLFMRYQKHSDIDALVDIWSNPEVTKFIGGSRKRDFLLNEFAKTAENPYAEKFDLWVVIEKSSGGIIGHCGFIDKKIEGKVEIDITYIFTPEDWGMGYATEMAFALKDYVFNKLGINRLIALIHPDNTASAKVAVKIGMTLKKQLQKPNDEIRNMFAIQK